MLSSQIITNRKESTTSKFIVNTSGNIVNTVNRLDSLVSVTLSSLLNNYNVYCSGTGAFNRRLMAFRSTTIWSDASISTTPLTYNATTSKWTTRNLQNCSANNTSSPAINAAGITALNAGTEISLFGSTYWTSNPTIDTISGTNFFTWDNTNMEFVNSGRAGCVQLLTLNVQMIFGTLPANSYFTFRIRDMTNSTILLTQMVYNTGDATDIYKMLRFKTVCRTTGRYKITVQYSGSSLTIYSSAMGSSRGCSISFQELGGSNIG